MHTFKVRLGPAAAVLPREEGKQTNINNITKHITT